MKRLLRALGHRCDLPSTRGARWSCWCGQRWVTAYVPLAGYRWHRAEREVRH